MAESHVISALTKKRSELAGVLAIHRKEVARICEEITSLDKTIKLFEPSYRIESIKPKRFVKKNDFFRPGEANRSILDVLRESSEPLSTNKIAEKLADSKGFGNESLDALKATTLTTLHRQRKNGLVNMTGKNEAGICCWELVA